MAFWAWRRPGRQSARFGLPGRARPARAALLDRPGTAISLFAGKRGAVSNSGYSTSKMS